MELEVTLGEVDLVVTFGDTDEESTLAEKITFDDTEEESTLDEITFGDTDKESTLDERDTLGEETSRGEVEEQGVAAEEGEVEGRELKWVTRRLNVRRSHSAVEKQINKPLLIRHSKCCHIVGLRYIIPTL